MTRPKGPHKKARYKEVAAAYRRVNGDIVAIAAEFDIPTKAVSQDLNRARRWGILPPFTQDAERWALETARISDLTVGTRGDLLGALGLDLVKRIAGECPTGVPLMVYIAGIVKDGYDTV